MHFTDASGDFANLIFVILCCDRSEQVLAIFHPVNIAANFCTWYVSGAIWCSGLQSGVWLEQELEIQDKPRAPQAACAGTSVGIYLGLIKWIKSQEFLILFSKWTLVFF